MVQRKILPVSGLILVQIYGMISLKFYVQTPFFSSFHNSSFRQGSYSDRQEAASLFSGVDSYTLQSNDKGKIEKS